MKSVYGDDCLCQTQVFALHKEFLEGRETAELRNSQHSGRPPTLSTEINVNTVRMLIDVNTVKTLIDVNSVRTFIEEDCSLTY